MVWFAAGSPLAGHGAGPDSTRRRKTSRGFPPELMSGTSAGERDTAVTSPPTTRTARASQAFWFLFCFVCEPPKELRCDSVECPGMSPGSAAPRHRSPAAGPGDRPLSVGWGPILALLSSPHHLGQSNSLCNAWPQKAQVCSPRGPASSLQDESLKMPGGGWGTGSMLSITQVRQGSRLCPMESHLLR